MRKITSHRELTEVNEEGQGFVFNNRFDRRMLHAAGCEALHAMTMQYQKIFFDGLKEARTWLDGQYGANGWEVCGRCR
jgi:hypothetical protein